MTDANNYPNVTPLTPRQARQQARLDALTTRAERQRQADNSGRPDRVAELAADIEVSVQAARWSMPVEQAEHVFGFLSYHLGDYEHEDGVWVSGDHRPRFRYVVPTKPAVLGRRDVS